MFFIDKYKPLQIKDIIYHKDIMDKLANISKDDSIPHIIFYGPESSGKKTLVRLFLELIYDKSVHKIANTKYTVRGNGSSTSEVIIQQSNFANLS